MRLRAGAGRGFSAGSPLRFSGRTDLEYCMMGDVEAIRGPPALLACPSSIFKSRECFWRWRSRITWVRTNLRVFTFWLGPLCSFRLTNTSSALDDDDAAGLGREVVDYLWLRLPLPEHLQN